MLLESLALEQATLLAQASGVQIRTVSGISGIEDVRWVTDQVWGTEHGTQVQPDFLRAMEHAGGYLSVAYDGTVPVASCISFIGRHLHEGAWETYLHSHTTAVIAGYRDRHIGMAIKAHQRWWALAQQLDVICWTFDPLMRRNAYFNLARLAAGITGYVVDFYGQLDDSINTGDPTDRLVTRWQLDAPAVISAMSGQVHVRTIEAGADAVTVATPSDIGALRSTDAAAAGNWRLSVREQIRQAAGRGQGIVGFTADGRYLMKPGKHLHFSDPNP